MKKTKLEKGITLVALIITIVVLLILAVVSIGAVKNSGIIGHASNVTSESTVAEEKEIVALAENEWQLQKNTPNNVEDFKTAIETALKNELTSKKIEPITKNEDGSLTITFSKTGNQYIIKNEIEPYTFTIEEFIEWGGTYSDGRWTISFEDFWKKGATDELKNSKKDLPDGLFEDFDAVIYNASCSDPKYTEYVDYLVENFGYVEDGKNVFAVMRVEEDSTDMIVFLLVDESGDNVDETNWTDYKELVFTISMYGNSSSSDTEPTLNSLTIGTLMEAGTEVTGTDGGSYYDISVQDFNKLIGQNILEQDFIYPIDKDDETSGVTISGFSDSETVCGLLRAVSYNTDPYIILQTDYALYFVLILCIKLNHNLEPVNVFRMANDPVYNFYLESGTDPKEGTFGVNLIIYTDDNAATENEKYFVRVAVGEYNSDSVMKHVYSKANIKENYPNVWKATLNVLSWTKVNRLLDKFAS